MRAVAYFRVSTAAQGRDDRNSLGVQHDTVTRYCAEHGYALTTVYTDVMSGRREARPAYQRMLTAARNGECDVIVVMYLDRFGRNDEEITLRVLELRRLNIQVEATEERIPSFIELALSAWKAGQEVQRISDRVTENMAAAARRGVALGRTPYGYRRAWEYTPDGRKTNIRFEVYEPEARWVRWAFEQYAHHNASFRSLGFIMSTEAPPRASHKPWKDTDLIDLLGRRRYTGVWTYQVRATPRHPAELIEVPGAIPAIVSQDLFEAAQRRRAEKRTLPAGRTQSSPYLLSGILRCQHCGGKMYGRPARPQHGLPAIYFCNNAWAQRGLCDRSNTHSTRGIDAAVMRYLHAMAENLVPLREAIGERSNADRETLSDVTRTITAIDDRFRRNLRLYDQGILAEDQFATANHDASDEKRRLTVERDRLLERILARGARQQEIATLPEALPALLDVSRPARERKALIQRYVARIDLTMGDKRPTIYPRLGD